MRVVVALGGNALSPTGGTGSAAEMRAALAGAAEALADLVGAGAALVLTHGNGPQVGRILLQQEAAAPAVPPMPMDVCGAESQGQIGYLLAQALGNALRARGLPQRVFPLITQVVVDGRDPAFRRPTKPVGPAYDAATAQGIATASGHVFGEVTPGRWRRLVASPLPVDFVEAEPMRLVAGSGHVLVAARRRRGAGGAGRRRASAGWRRWWTRTAPRPGWRCWWRRTCWPSSPRCRRCRSAGARRRPGRWTS